MLLGDGQPPVRRTRPGEVGTARSGHRPMVVRCLGGRPGLPQVAAEGVLQRLGERRAPVLISCGCSGEWRNGRRARFRSVCPQGRGGSTPPSPTTCRSSNGRCTSREPCPGFGRAGFSAVPGLSRDWLSPGVERVGVGAAEREGWPSGGGGRGRCAPPSSATDRKHPRRSHRSTVRFGTGGPPKEGHLRLVRRGRRSADRVSRSGPAGARREPKAVEPVLRAFANAEGGTVLIGLSEGTVQGVDGVPQQVNAFRQAAMDFTVPSVRTTLQFIACVGR